MNEKKQKKEVETSKEDSTIKCPNCDEVNMKFDVIEQMWQCLSCGHREEAYNGRCGIWCRGISVTY